MDKKARWSHHKDTLKIRRPVGHIPQDTLKIRRPVGHIPQDTLKIRRPVGHSHSMDRKA